MNKNRYATIEEAQRMEFGTSGMVRTIDGDSYELLIGDDCHAWACRHLDASGDMVDWDYVPEYSAVELGLDG